MLAIAPLSSRNISAAILASLETLPGNKLDTRASYSILIQLKEIRDMVTSRKSGPTAVVAKQRKIQQQQDEKDAAKPKKTSAKSKPAVQTGAKKQPAPPMSRKHL